MKNHLKIGTLAVLLATVGFVGTASAFGGGPRGGQDMMRGGPDMMPTFEELDTNGDGVLSLDELNAQNAARFAEADANGDGALSAEEIAAMIQAQMQDRVLKGAKHMIVNLDQNDDGVLSIDEMRGPDAAKMIERLDTNGDGAISADEFDAAKDHRGGPRGGQDGGNQDRGHRDGGKGQGGRN